MVKSNSIFAPQNYVGAITGNYFISHYDGSIGCIRKHLERYGFDELWDYPLNEINHIVENHLDVVLVDCSHYEGDMYVNEYRWFEVPEDFDGEEDEDEEDDEEEYVPSSENGDYSPSDPWNSPGMKISDFI